MLDILDILDISTGGYTINSYSIKRPFQIIEDIVETFNGDSIKKSTDYTGFPRFLIGCLESLDIDVTKFIGNNKIQTQQREYFGDKYICR